ncbi:MAG TPA: DUF4198 domain-containing protein [Thermoanaerobaculia bacterium]|nr:DUF4198 domain-containing protein [Thermoanaerobaculia bacterium]
MRRRIPQAGLIVLGAALASPLRAHDTWLLPRHATVAAGSAVRLDLTSGMAFPAPETPIKPGRVARARCRLAGVAVEVRDRRAAPRSLLLTMPLAKPGMATLWVELAPRSIELDPKEVEEYLAEIGASEAIRRAWRAAGGARRWREVYTKHAKTFVWVEGGADDRSWADPIGMALEIVPEKDPHALEPGDELPVRVLKDGKPLPHFTLGLVHAGEASGVRQTTDDQGRAVFRLDRAGDWLLRGTDLRSSGSPGNWRSDFTTLTFSVAAPK